METLYCNIGLATQHEKYSKCHEMITLYIITNLKEIFCNK